MDPVYIAVMLCLAAAFYGGSKYFEHRQKKMQAEHCHTVTARVCGYTPLEGADKKGRPIFATRLAYEVEGKQYEVQLDDQVAEVDQLPEGSAMELLCSREDPSQCMLTEFPRRKGWF